MNTEYRKMFEVDFDAVLKSRFESGEGVVQIQPDMPDVALLAVIKQAAHFGKPFVVVPPAHDIKYGVRPVEVIQKLSDWPADQQAEVVPAWHALQFGQSGQGKPMLSDLNKEERESLNDWLSKQKGDPERGGCIDMMNWPGWGAVVERRAMEHATK